MNAIEAYLLARAYTNQALEGAGALKGAACQIKSITSITGGHRVTFEWEDDEGESSTETMDVMDGTNGTDGDDGVGIASITYKETDVSGNYVYTVTLTDSNSYDIICPKGPAGATGQTGATGNGIVSIEKTSTVGLVDTYTITYTNGTTSTFTVTNGQDGDGNEFIGTTAEWNALTTAQKKEYDTYQLTDDYTEGKYIYLPTIYSEEEREVGVWKDGKPLYQKSIPLTSSLSNGSWNNEFLGTKGSGISIKSFCGLVYGNDTPNLQFPINYYIGTTEYVSCITNYDGDDLNILPSLHDIGTLYTKHITIQYTKTTDTAGSGTWTPTGEYAHHYSTDEQIVGTWIDGSTVYERTWDLGSDITLSAGQWVNMSQYITISNCDKMIVSSGVSSEGVTSTLESAYNAGYLELRHTQFNGAVRYVTLQYTKTA